MWHHFTPSSDDDQMCTRCELTVDDAAVDLIAVACPAPACTDPTNTGPCVMVLTEGGAACAYCGVSGTLEVDEDDPDAEPDVTHTT